MGISSGGIRIKALHRGIVTIPSGFASATVTIPAVNTAKAEVRYCGADCGATATDALNFQARLYLNNSTTVGAIRSGTPAVPITVTYEVTEWE